MRKDGQKTTLDHLVEQSRNEGVSPKKDLWQGIESKLKARRKATKTGYSFWYGALAASFAIATFIGGWQLSIDSENQPVSALYTLAQQINEEQKRQVLQLKSGYQNAGYQRSSEQILNELDELEKARREITQALKESPNDPDLLDLLIWVNQQELNLLSQSYQPKNQQLQEI